MYVRCRTPSGRAGLDIDGIDGFEVRLLHPSEYLAIDHIGLTGPGVESLEDRKGPATSRSAAACRSIQRWTDRRRTPVGATGIRMVLDAAKQVSGLAGDYQVDGARRFGTLNIGGSTATTVRFRVATAGRRSLMDVEEVGVPVLPCPRTTTTRTGPGRGGRRPPNGVPMASRWSRARSPPTLTGSPAPNAGRFPR